MVKRFEFLVLTTGFRVFYRKPPPHHSIFLIAGIELKCFVYLWRSALMMHACKPVRYYTIHETDRLERTMHLQHISFLQYSSRVTAIKPWIVSPQPNADAEAWRLSLSQTLHLIFPPAFEHCFWALESHKVHLKATFLASGWSSTPLGGN